MSCKDSSGPNEYQSCEIVSWIMRDIVASADRPLAHHPMIDCNVIYLEPPNPCVRWFMSEFGYPRTKAEFLHSIT